MDKVKISNTSVTIPLYQTTIITNPQGGLISKTRQVRNTFVASDLSTIRTASNGPGWRKLLREQLVTGSIDASGSGTLLAIVGGYSRTLVHVATGNRITYINDSPYSGNFNALSIPTGDVQQAAFNEASQKLLKKALKNRQLMILAAVGEAKQSALTLASLGKDLVEFTRKSLVKTIETLERVRRNYLRKTLKRKHRMSGADYYRLSRLMIKRAAEERLRWSFGVRPMLADLDAASSAAAFAGSKPRLVRGRGEHELSITGTGSEFALTPLGGRVRSNLFASRKSVVKLLARLETSTEWEVKVGQFGLLPADVAPSLWELVPYSWLVDIVSNIGDIIEALSYWNFNPSPVQETIFNESRKSVETGFIPDPAPGGYVLASESYRYSRYTAPSSTLVRRRRKQPPIPALAFGYDPAEATAINLASFVAIRSMKALNALRANAWGIR